MTKVLIVSLVGFDYEGITSVIYNYCSNMDRSGLELEFIVYDNTAEDFKRRFSKFGALRQTANRKKNFKQYLKDFNRLLAKGGYDVVHIHGNSGTMLIEAFLAKLHNVKKIIVHAHNTKCDHPMVNAVLTPVMKMTATNLLACSDAAGKWLYKKSKYTVLDNAIDTERFLFDEEKRKNCRREFSLTDEFLIGNIGNFFTERKNQTFLLDVFSKVIEKEPKARLLLAGDGKKIDEVRQKAQSMGIGDKVIFTGGRSDTENLYCAMDIFALPSLKEGLPVAMLEAQASGLTCLVSDSITREAKCTEKVFYKALEDGAEAWAAEILRLKDGCRSRTNADDEIRAKGFDITSSAAKLKEIYTS